MTFLVNYWKLILLWFSTLSLSEREREKLHQVLLCECAALIIFEVSFVIFHFKIFWELHVAFLFFFFFSYSHFWLIQRNCIIIIICFLCSCIGWTSLPQLHILSLVFSVISFVRLVFLRPAFITPILTPWFSPSKVPSSWII